MSTKFQLKTGDVVIVTTGKEKGKQGKVLQAFPRLNRVVVEGVRLSKRHLRTRKEGEKGQIVEVSMPIHASNVMPIGASGKAIRHNKARAATK
jgi:large subunit ribosomal protein L24